MVIIKYLLIFILVKLAYNNRKKRYIYIASAVLLFLFSFIKTFCYQSFFGQKNDFLLPENFEVNIIPITQKETLSLYRDEYKIYYEPQAQINLYAKAVYIDFNDTFFSSFDYYSNSVYDTIAPIDLSVFIGSMAENWKKFKIKHERRVMLVYGDIKVGEWENIHIIPATENIRRGFETIKAGDDILLKGFLINWQGTGNYNYLKMETALSFETISKEQIAGRNSWLCMQLYATELRANGYIYK